jgi:hypothetical protein
MFSDMMSNRIERERGDAYMQFKKMSGHFICVGIKESVFSPKKGGNFFNIWNYHT